MRVKQFSTETATKAPQRSSSLHQHSQYMEASFRTTNRAHDSSPEDATVKMRDGGESYSSLVRHNSAVFEHDVNTNRSSLVRTVSEVREEIMQLGCNHTADGNRKKDGYGSDGKPEGKLVRQVSHEVSHESYTLPTPPLKKGQLDSFVLKNYTLQDRRTLSLPVGFVGRSTESQQTRPNDSDKTTSSSRNVSYSSKVIKSSSQSTTASSSSPSSSTSEFCIYDFDMEVERHSKSTLFFQAGTTLFTILAALFTLYLCIRFLTSADATSNRHVVDVASMYRNGFRVIREEDPGCDSQCRFFVKACPLLGLFAAGLAVVAGAWATDGRMWRRAHETMSCTHCEDYEDKRSRAEEADEKVQRAHRSKQQFMAYVFHNIRVPFNAIVLGLGHIRATADGTSSVGTVADKMDLVQMMLDCAETMTSVLDDVTDMGQWEVGQMELHRDEFDLMTVIKFLSWGLKDLIEQKNITFNMNVDDVANKLLTTNRVVGDKQRIVQTLGNFLSNAVKFTPAGGKLELDLQCEEVVDSEDTAPAPAPNFTAYTPSDSSEGSLLGATGIQILTKSTSHAKLANQKVARLRLSVKDNGIGISAADQAKLFEPYSFVTSGWVLKAGVSGLGLSMAKRFVERAGGSIGVESMEGSGSTFFFSIPFPLVPVDLDSEREQPKVDPVAALLQKSEVTQSTSSSGVTVVHESITVSRRRSNMSSKEDLKLSVKTQPMQIPEDTHEETDVIQRKVLLVEDTRINRIILRKVLQNLNIQCDEAENGQVAVDFYKEGRTYDLVLMDKEMPVMDGHEATRQLRMMGVKTPIVALTGNALATDRQSFFEAGVDDFQTKPLSRDKLVQLLARYGVECHCRKAAE